jgi:hypothetical protein
VGAPRELTPPLPAPLTEAGPPILPPPPEGAGEARLGGPTERGGPTLGGPTLPGPALDLGPVLSRDGAGEMGDKPGLTLLALPPWDGVDTDGGLLLAVDVFALLPPVAGSDFTA